MVVRSPRFFKDTTSGGESPPHIGEGSLPESVRGLGEFVGLLRVSLALGGAGCGHAVSSKVRSGERRGHTFGPHTVNDGQ